MPSPRSPRRARLAALVSVVLAITGFQFFLAPTAQANPGGTGLVISEVYGGGGNAGATYTNDFVELYNPTNAAIPLTGMSLQYRSTASTVAPAAGGVTNLNAAGSVPAHDWFVIQLASQAPVGAAVPNVDFVGNSSTNMAGANGQVYLANSTTAIDPDGAGNTTITDPLVIDFVGYGTAAIREGATAAPAPVGNTTSIARTAAGADTDVNSADFSVQTTMHPGAGTSPLSVTAPGAKSGVVGTPITPFNLAATGGAPPYTWGATGMPSGITVAADGTVSGTPDTANVYSPSVTVTDSALPTAGTDSKSFTYTITAAPPPVTPIRDIQGTGTSSPITGQNVNTQGVVTASYPTGGLNGFYVQTPGADTANASDAIFVYGGAGGFATYPTIGDSVDVAGTVAENFGLTELTSATWSPHGSSLGTVTPKAVVPGTDCPLPGTACDGTAALDTAREAAEGEAFQPTAPWTLTDVYDGGPFYTVGTNSSSNFGELGVAAESTKALIAPTELFDTQTQASQLADRTKWNNAHRIVVDDGSSTNYSTTTGSAFPWMTPTYVPRVGAAITFPAPAILISDFSQWRLLSSSQVVGQPTGTQPQLQQTRAANAAPESVGGDLKLATFNVLNFFPTDGNEYVAQGAGNACTYFTDRQGNQITTNSCGNPSTSSGNGPRGAANPANVTRQRDKIVAAINTANADIVSLEELENSAKFGKSRDFAITELVNALNAASTPGKWDFAPSPTGADLPALSDEDVIRTGFIYQPANVSLVGASKILVGSAPFANAREPLAQAFKKAGQPDSAAFAVIVNHFKSKGSGVDDLTGQGLANPDRINQANALVTFANDFKTARSLTKVFLVGDFNAYSQEDPVQVLTGAGYTELHSTTDPDEETYNFDGQIGSLDHVFANSAANATVTGADVWPINGYESVYYEYSRFNYNVTNLYDSSPFRSSDHSPEIVGINATGPVEPATRTIQILGTNDFHGRLQNDTGAATAGAAVLAGAVKQLRAANPDTVFAAAGDLIGASTFESFIAHDKPTIDALNEAGLEVSSVGNHEFDQGYHDLVDRVMQPASAANPEGGANWQYIGANLRLKAGGGHALMPTWTKDIGSVKVGFIGAVTEDLPTLVSPAGISELDVTSIVAETNTAANDLKAGGADVIVLLVHEGAPDTNCATMANPGTSFASIINGVNDKVDAIISGHTHLLYNCSFPVAGWAGRPVTDRPVVSAGQYGMALNQLLFTVDTASGQVLAKAQNSLLLKTGQTANYPADPATANIVAAAVANAAVLGAVPLGNLGGPFFRGKLADGTTENRGAESTLGNLVAEVQKWATRNPESGAAQIAFMNPGGLRQDMTGTGTGAFPRTLTYQQAAVVQPFANTLVNEKLTGAQIKKVLEQQWNQPSSRPFLKLGISKGFTYTAVPPPAGSPAGTLGTVTGMWLNGTPIGLATTYSVTVNSFLSSGGDGFLELNNGTNKQDTGKTDLQGMVDYMAAFGGGANHVDPWYQQNGINVVFPPAPPASYHQGDHVTFDVSGWSMTNALDTKDTAITVKLGATTIGTATLNNAAQAALPGFDVTGTASVDVVLPANAPTGAQQLTLVGASTGSSFPVPVQITESTTHQIQILGTNDFHGRLQNDTGAATAGAAVLAGAVKQLRAANPDTVFAAAGDLIGASTFESFIAHDKPTIDALNEAGLEVSSVGNHEFDQGYHDLVDRVMQPASAANPEGGANWQYIGANLRLKAGGGHALMPTWTKDIGSVKVGFIGAVTEDLPTLVSPAGISELDVTSIVAETNTAANDLKAGGADVIVLLVHEGAPDTNCATMANPGTSFASIINGVNDKVDAIISGHTHLLYNCSFPVAGWAGRPVTDRPVVSAGQYGMALNQLLFTVDTASGQVLAKAQNSLLLKTGQTANYPADPATANIVAAAVANAAVLGAVPLGNLGGPFFRGKLADGTTENRGAESTLGNLVAEVQKWATRNPESGAAQIAFMNPGGLRQDMTGTGTGAFPRTLTYQQAAVVQPFANTLVNEKLTGAQIKKVLEQQWNQPSSRPFLKLGISKGFTYTAVPPPAGSPAGTLGTVTGMWLNGTPIGLATTYSVTVNSFLSSGGDGFLELNNGTNKQDTGKTDLQGMVDYMAAFGGGANHVDPWYQQNGIQLVYPAGAPASYDAGDHVKFDVSGWSMTNALDNKDTEVVVKAGATVLGTFPLDNAAQAALPGFDTTGKATIDFVLPSSVAAGPQTLTLSGANTGTTSQTDIVVGKSGSAVSAPDIGLAYGQPIPVQITVTGPGATPSGSVQLFDGLVSLGTATLGADGKATITVPAKTLPVGSKSLTIVYSGDSTHLGSTGTLTVTTAKAVSSTNAPDVNVIAGGHGTVTVTVTAANVVPTGTITLKNGATVISSASLLGGEASFNLPTLSDGTTLTAEYSGDENVSPSSDTFTIHVGKATPIVSAGDVAGVVGAPVTVTVNVGGPAGITPSGTVTIRNGGTTIGTGTVSGGVASIVIAGGVLPAGDTSLTAEYGGDANLGAGTDSFSAHMNKASSSLDADVKPNHPKKGDKVKMTVKVTAANGVTPTGVVTFKVDGKTLTGVITNGKVKVTLGKFGKGTHKVKVSYDGSTSVEGSETTVKFKVT